MTKQITQAFRSGLTHGLFLFITVCIVHRCATAQTPSSYTYKAPGYVKKDYKKILVVVKAEPMIYRKKIEDAMVRELKDRRYNAIAAHSYFDSAERGDSARLMAKIDSLGVDAALVFDILGQQNQIQERGYFTASMYSVWGGMYFTISVDSDTRNVQMVYVKPVFVTRDHNQVQWSTVIEINLSKGIELSADELAMRTRRSLFGDKIL